MPTILFIEDDQTIAMGMKYSLTREAFALTDAHRPDAARSLLTSQRFDLVLLDLGLPDGSRYTLCNEIRAAEDTPIIIIPIRQPGRLREVRIGGRRRGAKVS